MKLVQAHVMTVDPYGPIMENFMMENKNFDAIPYGPICSFFYSFLSLKSLVSKLAIRKHSLNWC